MNEDFVRVYNNAISDDSCESLIEKFEISKDKFETIHVKDADKRISFEQITLTKHEEWKSVQDGMMAAFLSYVEQYKKDCSITPEMWPEKHGYEAVRMKRYLNNDYDRFDAHVDVRDLPSSRRFLAFFVYLNDVDEGGETEFYLPNKAKIEARRGRMVIFPPLWPWFHVGLKPISNSKYFIHSYCHYIE